MSWRRFLVLLRGLSPNSATVTMASSRTEMGRPEETAKPVKSDHAQQAFESLFSGGAPSSKMGA